MALSKQAIVEFYSWSEKTNISAKVVENEWPAAQAVHISSINKIKLSIEHWVKGIPWDGKGGMYEYHNHLAQERTDKGLPAGKYTNTHYRDKKYRNLDVIFEKVKSDGKLKSTKGLVHVGQRVNCIYDMEQITDLRLLMF